MNLDEAADAVLTKQRVVLGRLLGLPKKARRSVNKVATRMDFSGELEIRDLDTLGGLLSDDRFVKNWLGWPTLPFALFGYNEPGIARSSWLRARAGVQRRGQARARARAGGPRALAGPVDDWDRRESA